MAEDLTTAVFAQLNQLKTTKNSQPNNKENTSPDEIASTPLRKPIPSPISPPPTPLSSVRSSPVLQQTVAKEISELRMEVRSLNSKLGNKPVKERVTTNGNG